jgi:hypothetical protein
MFLLLRRDIIIINKIKATPKRNREKKYKEYNYTININ